jgi:hypothetical protein
MKAADERPATSGGPDEFGDLLDAIAREPVPEKLLDLAIRLQEALRKQRASAPGRGDTGT